MKWLCWKIAWWRWFLGRNIRPGDPIYGSGEERKKNLHLMFKRWLAREPKPPE